MTSAALFFFDYVDPLCWSWERALARRERTTGVQVDRHPLELRPPPSPLLDPEAESWKERWRRVLDALPADEAPPFPSLVPWSRKAHELALHARAHGRFPDVHPRIFRAYVEEGRDIGRVDVLVELAVEAGLDRSETKAVLDVDRYSGEVGLLRDEAERLGVRGVPTLLAGGRRHEGTSPAELIAVIDSLPPQTSGEGR